VPADFTARRVEVADSLEGAIDAIELCFERGWTDGLPVVPPTGARVRAMLGGTGRAPDELIGLVPPRMGEATVEAVAINAVMAGCRPDYLPVVIAALEAMLEERFNLNGVQATTHSCAPLAIVNGPVVGRIGLNAGTNVFGQGFRANATIGRAIRLILTNLGGGAPDLGDKATHGHPGKFSFCIAENEAELPGAGWAPLHVERGRAPEESAVTVLACEAPQAILGGPRVIAAHMRAPGSNNINWGGEALVVLGPVLAHRLAQRGWAKHDVRQYLFEHGRAPLRELISRVGTLENLLRGGGGAIRWPAWLDLTDPDTRVPMVRRPEDLHLVVAGNAAMHFAALLPGWGYMGGLAVTRVIE
jgi:hypothetical protein